MCSQESETVFEAEKPFCQVLHSYFETNVSPQVPEPCDHIYIIPNVCRKIKHCILATEMSTLALLCQVQDPPILIHLLSLASFIRPVFGWTSTQRSDPVTLRSARQHHLGNNGGFLSLGELSIFNTLRALSRTLPKTYFAE